MMKQFSYRHTKEAEFMENMEEAELFSFAGFNQEEAEKTGYSNYSYWYSTFRAFLKNRGGLCPSGTFDPSFGIYFFAALSAGTV